MKRDTIFLTLLLLSCITYRLWFWNATNLTLEDSFITFRYAENIAAGNGFVYNTGEKVLGTTTPLWTLILAGMKTIGCSDIIVTSKVLSIIFDCLTLMLIFSFIREAVSRFAGNVWAVLFVCSPEIVPVSI